ncbi:unnamed protein product [Rotaria sp. Silwood2]|nr:unnamed protein product [Rotaria sp. Silwood2]CAF2784867.1 unnamed protein product [Rotaria sp. Silwood2]CAF4059554.1 unnamed protein product [Rotaria sp. Silwood2]CAF4186855.1 unnamed protein product [Rotaria sp. Silwood2]
MGTAESKGNQRHRANKRHRYNNDLSLVHKCQHKKRQLEETLNVGSKSLSKETNETIAPLISSSPLNPHLQGSILHHSFPIQRSHSEIRITSYEPSNNEITGSLNQFDHMSYDYQKDMQRVDEENRPVLEGLCPDKMYVSTNDLRICDTQRLPPPLRCKMTQGFFRPIPPSQFYQKKSTLNSSFL